MNRDPALVDQSIKAVEFLQGLAQERWEACEADCARYRAAFDGDVLPKDEAGERLQGLIVGRLALYRAEVAVMQGTLDALKDGIARLIAMGPTEIQS